jgi:hypothetical protein
MASNKFIVNEKIQDLKLYGELKEEDISKKHLTQELINQFIDPSIINLTTIAGEENLGIQKICVGGIIVTPRYIGENIVNAFNDRQREHIANHTMAHKILCERRDEAACLLFLTLRDLTKEYSDGSFKNLDNGELCKLVQSNLYEIVEDRLPWIIDYSKHVVRDYYSISTNRLKIKLNFILDDGIHDIDIDESNGLVKNKGGLLLNGFLDELKFYEDNLTYSVGDDVGIICQVLCPSGLPRNKKWIQIDIGISFSGKRQYKESVTNALIREAKEEIHIKVHDDVINTANVSHPWNTKLFYGSLNKGVGYEGFEVQMWEVLYEDQIQLLDEEPRDYSFCRCEKRNKLINAHKKILRHMLKK